MALILFLINVLLLVYLFNDRKEKPHPDRNRNIIIDKLNFDEQQIVQYDSLIKIHRTGMHSSKKLLMELKNNLYNHLNEPYNESLNDSLIIEINKVQNEIEHIHIRHFNDIKNICKPEQLKAYKELTGELARLFTSAPPPKRDQ